MTSTEGIKVLTANETPAINPAPPTGITITSTLGTYKKRQKIDERRKKNFRGKKRQLRNKFKMVFHDKHEKRNFLFGYFVNGFWPDQ